MKELMTFALPGRMKLSGVSDNNISHILFYDHTRLH